MLKSMLAKEAKKMIYNFTPHDVNVIRNAEYSPEIRKFTAPAGTEPSITIKSSGVLNARISTVTNGELEDVPLFSKEIQGCDELPELNDGDYVIVSALYASAYRATHEDCSKLLLVADPVMSEDGKTFLGCRGLAPIF